MKKIFRKLLKSRGVLQKQILKNAGYIAIVAFFLYLIPLSILTVYFPIHSTESFVCSFLLFWFIISIIIVSRTDTKSMLNIIICFPIMSAMVISGLIFKFFLKKKYPEMEEEHYIRWKKIKTIQKQIKNN